MTDCTEKSCGNDATHGRREEADREFARELLGKFSEEGGDD